MATTFKWSGAGLSAGALTTSSAGTGDTAPSGLQGTGQTIEASGPRPPQILLTQVAATLCSAYWTITSRTTLFFRGYVTLDTLVTSNHLIARIGAGTSRGLDLQVLSTGKARIINAANAGITSQDTAAVLTPGKRYRVEITLTLTDVTVRWFDGENLSPLWTQSATGNNFGTDITRVTIGNPTSTPTNEPARWADLIVDDAAMPAPAGLPPSAPSTSLFMAT
jgi:hypothetical protein